MKKYRFLRLLILLMLFPCIWSCQGETKTIYPPLSNLKSLDSIKQDELNEPVLHQYLTLFQRPSIRPVYQEIEKNKTAEHDGFVVNLGIKNTSKNTTYNNILIDIVYFAKSKTPVGNEKILLKTAIKPGDSVVTTRKLKAYKNTGYAVKIFSAQGTQ